MGIYVKTTFTPQTGVWYHAMCVYSGTTMTLYVNGEYQSQGTATLKASPDPLQIGVFYTIPNIYFDGLIDEVRVYNRALSNNEIQQLYYSNLAKYDTGKWLFTDYKQCLVSDGIHNYTGSAYDLASNTQNAMRKITTSIPDYNPLAPGNFAVGSVEASTTGQTVSGQFDNYFQFVDRKGNSGWMTTIQLPLNMRGENFGFTITGGNISFKAIGIDTLEGRATTNVMIT